jgi:hypothetical protein
MIGKWKELLKVPPGERVIGEGLKKNSGKLMLFLN